MTAYTRLLMLVLLMAVLVACSSVLPAVSTSTARGVEAAKPGEASDHRQDDEAAANACPITEPSWARPPDDAAVQNPPAFGHYFVNEDSSIWASAWWTGQEEASLRASDEGTKVGWFRPAGAPLEITGRRIDAQAPPLQAEIPCCYPTRFQATGLTFPTAGCWEVTATAADRELSFVVWVSP